MSELVKRVARALYEQEKGRAERAFDLLSEASGVACNAVLMEPWEECSEAFLNDARAAIEAMMEPTRGMMDCRDAFVKYSDAVACWKTMIAEALR